MALSYLDSISRGKLLPIVLLAFIVMVVISAYLGGHATPETKKRGDWMPLNRHLNRESPYLPIGAEIYSEPPLSPGNPRVPQSENRTPGIRYEYMPPNGHQN